MPVYIYHPSGETLRQYEPGLQTMYEKSLPKHLGKVAIFSLSDFDPEIHPPQRLDVVGMRSDVGAIGTLKFLGEQAFGKKVFNSFIDTFSANRQLLSDVSDLLSDGKHVILGSTHQRTDDIASVLGAFEIALLEFDAHRKVSIFRDETLHAQLMIGKLITGLNAMGFYTPDLLGQLGDTYYSLPSGGTFDMSGIPEEIRRDYNSGVLANMKDDEDNAEKGLVRGIALSGTTLVTTPKLIARPKQTHASPFSNGTIGLMGRHYTIPVAVDIEGGFRRDAKISILPINAPIQHDDQAHQIGEDLAHEMTILTGVEHLYHAKHSSFFDATHIEFADRPIPIAKKAREL